MLVRIGIAAQIVGVCTKTLRRWERRGKLKPTGRTVGGHRRYETTLLTEGPEPPRSQIPPDEKPLTTERVLGYVRVSAAKQKEDLDRQRLLVQQYATTHHWEVAAIYQDIASGLNDRRPGLKKLIQTCRAGHIDRVVITYDDRLARFGTHLLEWLFTNWGVRVERIQPVQLTGGPEHQLLTDLLALVTSFAGKFYRLRRQSKPPPQNPPPKRHRHKTGSKGR
ncbi:MAG: IS607 family transposase [Candidatus Heimdallarchaeota archaeon]